MRFVSLLDYLKSLVLDAYLAEVGAFTKSWHLEETHLILLLVVFAYCLLMVSCLLHYIYYDSLAIFMAISES